MAAVQSAAVTTAQCPEERGEPPGPAGLVSLRPPPRVAGHQVAHTLGSAGSRGPQERCGAVEPMVLADAAGCAGDDDGDHHYLRLHELPAG